MRVSFFVNNYAPSRGGVQEHLGRVAEGLVARHGMQVDVLTSDALLAPAGPSPGRLDVGDEELAGVTVHRRPVARRCHAAMRTIRRAGRRLGCWDAGGNTLLVNGPLGLRYAWTARRLACRSDVVVGVSAPTASLWYSTHLAPSGVARVAMPLLHSDGDQARPWVLRSLRGADAVVANTPVEARWIVGQGISDADVHVLPPGCDVDGVVPCTPAEARRHLGLESS
ncbi:MAG: glycosyltransferase, partial [Actinobacteria bacterium]|nr:glycosyltransferase [Actinomycetota bacterium]